MIVWAFVLSDSAVLTVKRCIEPESAVQPVNSWLETHMQVASTACSAVVRCMQPPKAKSASPAWHRSRAKPAKSSKRSVNTVTVMTADGIMQRHHALLAACEQQISTQHYCSRNIVLGPGSTHSHALLMAPDSVHLIEPHQCAVCAPNEAVVSVVVQLGCMCDHYW